MKSLDSSRSVPTKSSVQGIDALFEIGGLVRSRRAGSGRTVRAAHLDRVAPEEITPAAPQPLSAANGVPLLRIPEWNRLGWLWHGFSTRLGGASRVYCAEDAPGEMNLGFTPADDREVVLQNRRRLAEAVTGDAATPLITVRQFHSNLIVIARRSEGDSQPQKADGVITAEPGLLLAIQTADCIPVLVADRKQRVVAAFHAGWRGTVSRIVESGVGKMRLEFGSRAQDLIATIGPGVGACCYAVGEEVQSEFESQFTYAPKLFREVYDSDPIKTKYPMLFLTQRAPGHSPIGPSLHLDLIEANRRQLLDAGVKPRAIQLVGGCTSSHRELFFSHRASQGHAGRMMSVIGIRP
ncbi:MAG TPA: peptidoglycan editing factor PgeF [Terracidiphilus sp.]|nr:peptidoglycan editing factor PgeF [Terracidiphilus sp.]